MESVLVFGHFDLFLAKESIRKKNIRRYYFGTWKPSKRQFNRKMPKRSGIDLMPILTIVSSDNLGILESYWNLSIYRSLWNHVSIVKKKHPITQIYSQPLPPPSLHLSNVSVSQENILLFIMTGNFTWLEGLCKKHPVVSIIDTSEHNFWLWLMHLYKSVFSIWNSSC